MAASQSGGVRHRITAKFQNLREYASNNQTSELREPLSETERTTATSCRGLIKKSS